MKFLGYERPDGCAGIRNHVLIIPGGLLAAKICDFVEDTKTILTADSGSGWTGRDLLSTSTAVVAPLMWTTVNPKTLAVARSGIDFYSGGVIEDGNSIEETGEKLLQAVLERASGTLVKVETIKHTDPTQIYLKNSPF